MSGIPPMGLVIPHATELLGAMPHPQLLPLSRESLYKTPAFQTSAGG